MRKLFCFLVFQCPAFWHANCQALENTLAEFKNVYFAGFIKGIDALYQVPVSELFGQDYLPLRKRLKEAQLVRDKIFHGQVTGKQLTRNQLMELIDGIRAWCTV